MTAALAGGVGAAGNEDVLAGEGGSLRCGSPVEDAGAEQGVQARRVEPAVGHARGDQDATRVADLAAGQAQREAARGGLEPGDGPGHGQDRAKRPCLLERPGRQARAADAAREAQVVADQRTAAGLPADGLALEQQRGQAFGGRVHRGRQAGRPGPDDGHVDRSGGQGRQAEDGRDLVFGRVHQNLAGVGHQDRQH